MGRLFFTVFFSYTIFLSFLPALITKEESKPFLFPMPINPMVSSGFGENRSANLHTGTDFRTYAVNGIPLLAAEDGYLDVIHGHPFDYGFGLALYVRYYYRNYRSVYGHIDDVMSRYHLNSAWRLYNLMAVDRYYSIKMPSRSMPVEKGQIVAYSGERGIGPEHLHYELRDENDDYLNSYHPDHVPVIKPEYPFIKSIHLLTPGRIMGNAGSPESSCLLKKRSLAVNPVYDCPHPLPVDGNVMLKARVNDHANAVNDISVYGISVFLDGEKIFAFRMDKIRQSEKGRLHSLYDMGKTYGWPYYYGYNLFIRPQDKKSIPSWIKTAKNDGILNTDTWAEGEEHELRLDVEDVEGKITEAHIRLKKAIGRPYHPAALAINREAGKTHTEKRNDMEVTTGILAGDAHLSLEERKKVKPVWYLKRTSRAYLIRFAPSNWNDNATGYFYAPYRASVGIYNQHGRMISSKYDKGKKAYYGTLSYSDVWYLAADSAPPSFSFPVINGPLKQEMVIIPVTDFGSGINPHSVQMSVDGILLSQSDVSRWNIRYDYDRRSLYIPTGFHGSRDTFQKGKDHFLSFTIRDYAGNQSRRWEGIIQLKE